MTELAAAPARGPLVVGVGNEMRGDDAAGLLVVRRLRARPPPAVRLLELRGEATALLDAWDGARVAIVVDAVVSGRPTGTVHELEVGPGVLPPSSPLSSTHGFSLADAIELGRALHRLPDRLTVFGIEGRSFAAGAPLSSGVPEAIDRVADAIAGRLASEGGAAPPREAADA